MRRGSGTQPRRNWYRCRFVYHRGAIAADQAGHPRALGIKEETILPELFAFMSKRLFGPNRLRLLKDEIAKSAASDGHQHDKQLAKLTHEHETLKRSIYRQTLHLEQHDDPRHPVAQAAIQRIEELSARQAAVQDTIETLKAQRPTGTRPEEIIATLDAIPDLRPTLKTATPQELADICSAFQITAVYDKANRTIELSAIVRPDLILNDETPADDQDRSGYSYIAGAGFDPICDLGPLEQSSPLGPHSSVAAGSGPPTGVACTGGASIPATPAGSRARRRPSCESGPRVAYTSRPRDIGLKAPAGSALIGRHDENQVAERLLAHPPGRAPQTSASLPRVSVAPYRHAGSCSLPAALSMLDPEGVRDE